MVGAEPLSADEELLKRNTDCVYFLASPLTCKKGTECEYRHSNIARVNPRDCYFWLHGDCSNWKCAFRHPPLEGLLGTQVPTSTEPTTKEGVPTCVFFKKGYCMKGDWCPFLHTPNPLINKPSPMPVATPPTEPAANKKALIGLENSLQEKKDQPMNMAIKSVKNSAEERQTFEIEPTSNRNKHILNRRAPLTAPVSNLNLLNSPVHVHQYRHMYEPESEPEHEHINSKDTEEFSRELSPGFDVLVDDDVRDTDYYPSEDGSGMPGEHEFLNEYDIGFSTDYNSIVDNDERYHGSIGYDLHKYGWEQQRGSSERRSLGGSYSEGRPYSRPDYISEADELDLRHHLEKRKKPNGLRSVISYENNRVIEFGDQRSYREGNCNSSRENSLSSRLHGRISLPSKSQSPNNMDNMIWGRLSPARVNINNDLKSYRGPHSRREDNASVFSGPKSFMDFKNKRNREHGRRYVTDQQQSMGKRKHRESGNDISFEGPKPLEEILKMKRGEKIENSSVWHT